MGTLTGFTGGHLTPGLSTVTETVEKTIFWGDSRQLRMQSYELDGASRDAGNTPTIVLRPGLLLGKVASSGKLKTYDPDGTDGTGTVVGVLAESIRMTDFDGNDQTLWSTVCVGGPIKAAALVNLDLQARAQMAGRFSFDDDSPRSNHYFDWRNVVPKTADYTLTAADVNCLFTTQGAAGAVVFTLPAPSVAYLGGKFGFFNEVNQNMTINCATADVIATFNDAAADSVAFSTTDEKIGAFVEFVVNADGTKWLCLPRVAGNTMTVAT
jgi:hypothetical protein